MANTAVSLSVTATAAHDPMAYADMPSREFGLALGLIFGKHFINMQDLHYGYWPGDLPVHVLNLPKAQAAYTELLINAIPQGTRTILDVGCSAGNNAHKLLDKGYQVDCVSPNGYLTSVAKDRLRDRAGFFESRIEDLQTDKKYDLILFSESLLFMPLELTLRKVLGMLNHGGHILITDIFKIPTENKSPIGGGQHLHEFRQITDKLPMNLVHEFDMTAGIAPTFDVLNQAYAEAVYPAYQLIMTRLTLKHPNIMKMIRWKFRKKIERYEGKHFSGRRTGAEFCKHKSYRLFLFKNRPHDGA